MSSRVTRSSARLAAAASSSTTAIPDPTTAEDHLPPPRIRKRKASSSALPSPEQASSSTPAQLSKRTKRQKVTPTEATPTSPPASLRAPRQSIVMAKQGSASEAPGERASSVQPAPESSKRKSGRNKKTAAETGPSTSASVTKRSKKSAPVKVDDATIKDHNEVLPNNIHTPDQSPPGDDDSDIDGRGDRRADEEDEDDGDDPFHAGFLGAGGHPGHMSSTLRALTGMISGVPHRLRDILEKLRQNDSPDIQYAALTELSEILLISTEDNLSGHFSPDQFVKELVSLLKGETGNGHSGTKLIACRCIAHLMEALPPSTANVVYGQAVPVLVESLNEIARDGDLAEQALITLGKISFEFPSSIVREKGLTACLEFLDFFPTSTQRTAVITAANCCRNIPQDCFMEMSGVMNKLDNILTNSDHKVVEQASLCVSRIIESFKNSQDKLEQLIKPGLLRAIRRLLLPATTNMIGPNIHTQFLRVLSITARASPKLSMELLTMDIVDTLFQILTGVSPPDGLHRIPVKTDSVVIMQALIHRPREQIYETLNVVCELLPRVDKKGLSMQGDLFETAFEGDDSASMPQSSSGISANSERLEVLKGCKTELRRFAVVLFPTLTDAYSSTVNLSVRQKVLTAQLKMLSNFDTSILEDALRTVAYASFLAAILAQQDHPTLVAYALQAAELLLVRMEPVYRNQFYREGVISEISKLADKPLKSTDLQSKVSEPTVDAGPTTSTFGEKKSSSEDLIDKVDNDGSSDSEAEAIDDDDAEDENEEHEIHEDLSSSDSDSSSDDPAYTAPDFANNLEDCITLRAKKFLEVQESGKGKSMRDKASVILSELRSLAGDIKECYLGHGSADGFKLFTRLSKYFLRDELKSITSAELLSSEIGSVLLEVFNNPNDILKAKARKSFLQVFMNLPGQGKSRTSSPILPATPFSVLVHKLQDVLSREEHFEVVTIHHNSLDSNRSSATSMISKQIRLKLVADDDSGIPKPYRNMMISVHAIATFKALDDYLRPRISLADRPKASRHRERDSVSSAMAALTAAGVPRPSTRLSDRAEGVSGNSATPATPSSATPGNRQTRKASKTKPTPPASEAKDQTSGPRRSSRKYQQASKDPTDTPTQARESTQSPLECADERQLTDEDDLDDTSALDAIVDDLEDGMDDEQIPDPTAVNMEVASTGKVTARKEDGTRIATPSQAASSSMPNLPTSRARELLAAGLNPAMAGRAMSYAAAIQAVPQDWHIEFSINDQPISNDTTIFRAVHQSNISHSIDPSGRNVWSGVHTAKFRRAQGPPPPEASSVSSLSGAISSSAHADMAASLHEHPTTSTILRLLNILHESNANLEDVLDDSREILKVAAEPVAQFINIKLTAKLNRQLEEPLIVASNCLPSWSEDLPRLYPFLFPFETRHLFLQSTSFGYARSMSRWQSAQPTDDTRRERHRDERPFIGRLQRQKVRISRSRILESAVKVMELYGASPSMLEVEYFEEVGTGLGPTLEFYSTVSKEFSRRDLKLWRDGDSTNGNPYAFGKLGLFPAPMSAGQAESETGKKTLHYFKMLGKFIARSMLDSRIIEVSLNPTFFRVGNQPSTVPLSLGAVKTVDESLASSLKLVKQFAVEKEAIEENSRLSDIQKANAMERIEIKGVRIEDLALDFTLPGYPQIELIAHGADIAVDIYNVADYVDKVIGMTLGSGVQRQVEAFRSGFSQVFPFGALRAFTPQELVLLFGRVEEDWSLETLLDSIKADHGYNMDSKSVRNLLQVMSELSSSQRRDFLQFVTGSPKLPIGGFKSLTPLFTVVCKPSEPPFTSDDFLVSVMTCANYVKLPDYSDMKTLKARLLTAIQEGQGAFHLS